jgi:hypothetical protein
VIAKEYFAALATAGKFDFEAIRDAVARKDLTYIDPQGLARLARIVSLQSDSSDAIDFAVAALTQAYPLLPQTDATLLLRKLLVELLFSIGQLDRCREYLASDLRLRDIYHGYLLADAHNPFVSDVDIDFSDWLALFNAPMVSHQLQPAHVQPSASVPFNTLGANVEGMEITDGPLVSVILTSYNPTSGDLRASLDSILAQTWRPLEVLLVDDHSTDIEPGLLEELAGLDHRVRLIRLPQNGGTYRARNAGLLAATGQFVTGQDADDWSHPERICRQVEILSTNSEISGVITSANRTDDRLVRISAGLNPHRNCEITLMTRRSDALAVRGYLPVRKGADSEFRERIEVWTGRPVHAMPEPLYMIRMTPGSLSRSDFRPGWSHPARRAFWSAYKHWHKTAEVNELCVGGLFGGESLPFQTPSRIQGDITERRFDLCFAADWRINSFLQRSALDEVSAALEAGRSVSILQLESPFTEAGAVRSLTPELQTKLNCGEVGQVFVDEPASIGMLIVRDPSVLDFGPDTAAELSVGELLLVAEPNPATSALELKTYDPIHTQRMAHELFRAVGIWVVPQGQSIQGFEDKFALPTLPEHYPLVVDQARFEGTKRSWPHATTIIGRAARNSEAEWPVEPDVLAAAYPFDESTEVRILGDARGALRVLKQRSLPTAWLDFRESDIREDVFWRSLDFVLQYDRRDQAPGFTRDLLEAMSAGVVVIADKQYGATYGPAVCTAEPSEAACEIARLTADATAYDQQATVARTFVGKTFCSSRFLEFINRRLTTGRWECESLANCGL